ncbi:ABC transporter ATP-binding protein [Rhizomonospora bruguierae]|uniref:ABC transporter ATP-binding protein n=1 Tax=Rhizomonospora bruguierae TaxID=1581705 RepID=UPI001BCD8800|nr:ATP-binding cassette domain-containing protein [Micromonospora sp. NBRC 107566]
MLRIDGLHKTYGGDKAALDSVSFSVGAGEIFGFIGPNGAGKSTTMRILMGVLEPTSGSITWNGRPIDRGVRRTFGYMPEERGLYQKMKVREQIRWFGRLYGLVAAESRRETDALIDRLNLGAFSEKEVQALSLGNQQRVQLAVALVHRPRLLVLDEPFSGLDPGGVDDLAALLRERRDDGVSIIFSSHQLELVERMIDALGIIDQGRMIATGTVDELQERNGRRLRVALRDAKPGWTGRVPGRVFDARGGEYLIDAAGSTPRDVLVALMREGDVEQFGWDRPQLVEIFREMVA